jgi:hypothetical protein
VGAWLCQNGMLRGGEGRDLGYGWFVRPGYRRDLDLKTTPAAWYSTALSSFTPHDSGWRVDRGVRPGSPDHRDLRVPSRRVRYVGASRGAQDGRRDATESVLEAFG